MNSPTEQATLYRKAAETIEMCAEHEIEPIVRVGDLKKTANVCSCSYCCDFEEYEFPLAVIEGKLVWEGDELYGVTTGEKYKINKSMHPNWITSANISWNKPKQPLCEVEGKPVYAGDMLWLPQYKVAQCVSSIWNKEDFNMASWNPPKRTVMVELPMNTVESYAATNIPGGNGFRDLTQIVMACRKALDNLK